MDRVTIMERVNAPTKDINIQHERIYNTKDIHTYNTKDIQNDGYTQHKRWRSH